jgi:hypothetical protein
MSEKLSVKRRIVLISNELRVGKDGKNTYSNYDYFKPDDIMKALNPLLEKYNLITMFNLLYQTEYSKAELVVADCDSDEHVEYIFDIQKATLKGTNEAQNSGATLTYAKRYSLMNIFSIADNDADFDSDKATIQHKIAMREISADQAKRAYTLAKSVGLKEDDVKAWIYQKYNKTSLLDLKKDEYNALCEALEKKGNK